jgi:peptidoglycan/LPS O-acetylase OafA/YrhL
LNIKRSFTFFAVLAAALFLGAILPEVLKPHETRLDYALLDLILLTFSVGNVLVLRFSDKWWLVVAAVWALVAGYGGAFTSYFFSHINPSGLELLLVSLVAGVLSGYAHRLGRVLKQEPGEGAGAEA